jgi:hypothetical protein
MSDTLDISATGISPMFEVTAEEFILNLYTTVTRVDFDGVQPPLLGEDGGYSQSMALINNLFPWVDEKLVEPKFDGVCQYLGICSNQPTFLKDFHLLALFRSVDVLLSPSYIGIFEATTNNPYPIGPPPTPSDQF